MRLLEVNSGTKAVGSYGHLAYHSGIVTRERPDKREDRNMRVAISDVVHRLLVGFTTIETLGLTVDPLSG